MLIGHVGREPEVRYIDNGVATAVVSLATNTPGYTLPGGTQVPERTEWHRIMLWRRLAEIVERYVHKGDQISSCSHRARSRQPPHRARLLLLHRVLPHLRITPHLRKKWRRNFPSKANDDGNGSFPPPPRPTLRPSWGGDLRNALAG